MPCDEEPSTANHRNSGQHIVHHSSSSTRNCSFSHSFDSSLPSSSSSSCSDSFCDSSSSVSSVPSLPSSLSLSFLPEDDYDDDDDDDDKDEDDDICKGDKVEFNSVNGNKHKDTNERELIDLVSSFLVGPPNSNPNPSPPISTNAHASHCNNNHHDTTIYPTNNANEKDYTKKQKKSTLIHNDNHQHHDLQQELPQSQSDSKETHRVVIFTKDRPWQLHQLLRSMQLQQLQLPSSSRPIYPMNIQIVIVARVNQVYKEAYDSVRREYATYLSPHCHQNHKAPIVIYWRYETPNHDNDNYDYNPKSDYHDTHAKEDPNTFSNILEQVVYSPQLSSFDSSSSSSFGSRVESNKHLTHSPQPVLLLFLTDDCILLQPLHRFFQMAQSTMIPTNDHEDTTYNSRILGIATRLHPGITWSQTRNRPSLPPRTFDMLSTSTFTSGVYVYPRRLASVEWSYPFDLSGGVYRRLDVAAILDSIRFDRIHCHDGKDDKDGRKGKAVVSETYGYSHPNRLEVSGNVALANADKEASTIMSKNGSTTCKEDGAVDAAVRLSTLAKHRNLLAVPTHPYLVVLAINRVQDVCRASLALDENHHDFDEKDALSRHAKQKQNQNQHNHDTRSLLTYLHPQRNLDLERYRTTPFNATHIGAVHLLTANVPSNSQLHSHWHSHSMQGEKSTNKIMLSVLIPVHNGPPTAASHAMRSIVLQPIQEEQRRILEGRQRCEISPVREGAAKDACFETMVDMTDCRIHTNTNLNLFNSMQIVLVDDRCEDGSIDCMIASAREIVERVDFVTLLVRDYRSGSMEEVVLPRQNGGSDNGGGCVSIWVDVVQTPRPGVAAALNFGLGICRSEFVARMDADDVASPLRLVSQMSSRLWDRPELAVVGMSSVLFWDDHDDDDDYDGGGGDSGEKLQARTNPYMDEFEQKHQRGQRTSVILPFSDSKQRKVIRCSVPPTDAGFVAWTMMFSCVVSHPSVMYRKSEIQRIGGYDESLGYAEDYDLWLRLVKENCRSVCSIPRIGVWHRKHKSSSSSGAKKVFQKNESKEISKRYMTELLCKENLSLVDRHHNCCISDTVVSFLKNTDKNVSLKTINDAGEIICKLENLFLRKHSGNLTNREIELIKADCDARIGEIALSAVRNFGRDVAKTDGVWRLWCERCPDLYFDRLALLCHN